MPSAESRVTTELVVAEVSSGRRRRADPVEVASIASGLDWCLGEQV